jgi:hypothetical protein
MFITANPRMIDVRYHDFNGFPAVNWYSKPFKADNGGKKWKKNGKK